MGLAYLVLAAIAALGAALGWRMTPARAAGEQVDGLARLLQLGIALTGLSVLATLLIPWFLALDQIACTDALERAGKCVIGLSDRGLFGAAAFAGLTGAAFALVLRKGVLDFPEAPMQESEAGVGGLDTIVSPNEGGSADARDADARDADAAPADPDASAPADSDAEPAEPASDPDAVSDTDAASDEADDTSSADEPSPEREASQAEGDKQAPHRRHRGPVFRAFVDDEVVDLDRAIQTAAERLHSERVAVVFSRGASKDANVALLELAEAFDAHRYVLEGTAAATEGIPRAEEPDPHAADEVAGPSAHHAGQLALDLAGSLIQTVFLLDTRVAFPEFVLGKLTELQSVCIAHAHDEVSGACQVVLPGTNPGEREGELIDIDGGANARRTRAWLVGQIVAALTTLEPTDDEPANDETAANDEPASDEPAQSGRADAAESSSSEDQSADVEDSTSGTDDADAGEGVDSTPGEDKPERAEP